MTNKSIRIRETNEAGTLTATYVSSDLNDSSSRIDIIVCHHALP